VLQSLPGYVPGRTVPGAVKLASNEIPFPPLPSVIARVADAAASMNRYPDNGSVAVQEVLADRLGVAAAQVVVGCGSVSLCTQLVQAAADAGDEALYAWRSFEAYPIIAAVSGASSVQVPLRDHVHDLDAMVAAITGKTRVVFVCNPNNPTGTVVGAPALRDFLRAVPDDVVVALDEAYREFVTDDDVPDGLSLLDAHPNLVVLRTFSKAYGLAGLRVGYAVASDPAVAAALRQTQVPFAVSTVAQAAALASLEPPAAAELRDRVAAVVAERAHVVAALHEIGYVVPATQANFVWLPLGDGATAFGEHCERQGVIVRPFAGHGVRVTIGTAQENARFIEAAGAYPAR
jgi:histidinol-phosphate aminotransferase